MFARIFATMDLERAVGDRTKSREQNIIEASAPIAALVTMCIGAGFSVRELDEDLIFGEISRRSWGPDSPLAIILATRRQRGD